MTLVHPKEQTLFTILAALAAIAWLALLIGTVGTVLIYVLFGFVFYLFAQSGLIAYLKGDSVSISRRQFPDLAERIKRCARTLDMEPPSQAFLLHGGGIFNAFATRFLGKNYIALYSDVVDALEDHPDAIDFYIGHELGHLKRKHLLWGALLIPVKWLPLIGPAYSRACESTCDRHGLACCNDPKDARLGLAALAAGGKRWKLLEQHEYASQTRKPASFWMSFHELCSDYPWLSKRMSALLQLADSKEPEMPARNPLAYVLAAFVPRTGIPGGGALLMLAMIGILAAVALPAYQQYQAKAANEFPAMPDPAAQYPVDPGSEQAPEEPAFETPPPEDQATPPPN